jgi:two-component system nitrogen regulation sensor histidine kinase GlnL
MPESGSGVFSGLDWLAAAVVVLDDHLAVRHMNPAAENLFAVSSRSRQGKPWCSLLGKVAPLIEAVEAARRNHWGYTAHDIRLRGGGVALHLDCTVTPAPIPQSGLLLEFRPIDRHLRSAREEQLALQRQANQDLIRNLAHEIKNPLGGIRGSAQLLDRELEQRAVEELREYTEVIIREADRLQGLMQRLLSSHRVMQPAPVNIHDVLEQVRRLVASEFPAIEIQRDFDISIPELTGDRGQLIQALLNVVRNAAQALSQANTPDAQIILRTRALRQVTIAKRRYVLALELLVIDNGPGIAEHLRDKIFWPLVSGRPEGSGLGLALAQGFIQQHHGDIEAVSRPGHTVFCIRLPLAGAKEFHS